MSRFATVICDTVVVDPLDDLVDDLAATMGAPCLLEDVELRLLGYSQQDDVDQVRRRSILERGSTEEVRAWFYGHGIREARSPLRTPEDPDRGIVSRVCVPVRHLDRLYGFFWLLDPDHHIDPARWDLAEPIAAAAGSLLNLAERRQSHRDALYHDVVEGGSTVARAAASELAGAGGFALDEPVVCVLIRRPDLVSQLPSRQGRTGRIWVRDSEEVAAAVVRADVVHASEGPTPEALLVALGLSRRVADLDAATRIGVGPAVAGLDHLGRSRAGAAVALRVAEQRGDVLTCWEHLGPLALLGVARDSDLAWVLLGDGVGTFVREGAPSLLETARTYLASGGSAAATATALGTHRQTVYARLRQVEQVTGLDLAEGEGRLRLHLALELAPYLTERVR